ncbi:MAG TPA: SDR family oxidoreductase [Gammaproteobacteria bacterium]|nr:SDR family oxidoreductase [Gammaproteobacteria bacterium]
MSTLFSLEGEVAVVTGALGKLGPVWTEALLQAGASVFALDRPGVPATPLFGELQARFGNDRLQLAYADVRDRDSLEEASRQCEQQLGLPSVLVNNAGIDSPPAAADSGHRLEDIPLEVNREILEVNTLGMFLVSQVFGRGMVAARRGSVVNVASLYAGVSPDARFYDHIESDPPFLKPPAYGASKAAVVNLTRYLATHWAPHGVRVNALSPGGVLGGQDETFRRKFCARVPMGRMAESGDLAGPLLFLASGASSYVTGTELVVDGGFTAW